MKTPIKTCKSCGNQRCWRCKKNGVYYKFWIVTDTKTNTKMEFDSQKVMCHHLEMRPDGVDKYIKLGLKWKGRYGIEKVLKRVRDKTLF